MKMHPLVAVLAVYVVASFIQTADLGWPFLIFAVVGIVYSAIREIIEVIHDEIILIRFNWMQDDE